MLSIRNKEEDEGKWEFGMGIVCTKLSNCRVADPPCMIKIEDEKIQFILLILSKKVYLLRIHSLIFFPDGYAIVQPAGYRGSAPSGRSAALTPCSNAAERHLGCDIADNHVGPRDGQAAGRHAHS